MTSLLLTMATLSAFADMNPFGSGGKAIISECSLEMAGNAFVTRGSGATVDYTKGLVDWSDSKTIVTAYFGIGAPQKDVDLFIVAKGSGEIGVNINGKKTVFVKLDSDVMKEYNLGRIEIGGDSSFQKGYQKIYLRGKTLGKDGKFGEVERIILRGLEGVSTVVPYADSYWGRRGPSVHLRYELPKYKSIEYIYNEITVLKDQDPEGSYYMANGFGEEGYFGFQTLENGKRIVIFSVWSPFKTDDPREIPEELKVKCVRLGKNTKIGDFGNEGSGSKTIMPYEWETGKTYGFLTRVHPNNDKTTDYTSYFFDKEKQRWHLVAKLRRPKTNTWLRSPYSFVENFSVKNGYKSRAASFSNTWVWDKKGDAFNLDDLTFTTDATGQKGIRTDFTAYLNPNKTAAILKMGGFFNENCAHGTTFERQPLNRREPMINFAALERLD
ncbi:MAG: DUF3472 domain-containing protein [Opitutales bacterium]|nr:DUF3472 domain-containing protein [Opitutales bacterium]